MATGEVLARCGKCSRILVRLVGRKVEAATAIVGRAERGAVVRPVAARWIAHPIDRSFDQISVTVYCPTCRRDYSVDLIAALTAFEQSADTLRLSNVRGRAK